VRYFAVLSHLLTQEHHILEIFYRSVPSLFLRQAYGFRQLPIINHYFTLCTLLGAIGSFYNVMLVDAIQVN